MSESDGARLLRLAADALAAQPPKLRRQYVAALRLYAEEPWRLSDAPDARTHGLNHAPLPPGNWLAPGFCNGCDEERARAGRHLSAFPRALWDR